MELTLRKKRHSESEQQQIAKLYHDGFSSLSIGSKMNCSTGYVYVCAHKYPKQVEAPAEVALPEQPAVPVVIPEPAQITSESVIASDRMKLAAERAENIKDLRFNKKMTVIAIAKQLGVHENTVRKVLKRTTCESLETATQIKSPKGFSKEKSDTIYNLLEKGKSDEYIAKQVGCHKGTVQKWRTNGSLEGHIHRKAKATAVAPVANKITDKVRAEVIRHHRDNYYSASTIAAELGIEIADVVEILREDKLNS